MPRIYPDQIPENSRIRRIKYLTFQGGGMKGIGFVGALEELEASGVLPQIEEVAGTSVGSIVALLVALGYTAAEVREEMVNLSFKSLQDKSEPGWIESSGLREALEANGGSLENANRYDLLKRMPVVKQAFSTPGKAVAVAELAEDVLGLAFGEELGLWQGEALMNLITRLIVRKTGNPNLTVLELEKLAKANPGVFRVFHATGTNITTQELENYNAKTTPNMKLVDIVRISTSVPGGFKPVTKAFSQKEKEDLAAGNVTVRVDGGLLANVPRPFDTPPYHSPTEDEPTNPEVLVLAFESQQSQKPRSIKTGIDLVKALYATKDSDDQILDEYGDQAVRIPTKGMGTLEFDASKSKRLALAASGGLAVQNALQRILKQEQDNPPDFEDMSDEELIRQKVAFEMRVAESDREIGKERKVEKDWKKDKDTKVGKEWKRETEKLKSNDRSADRERDPLWRNLRRIHQILEDRNIPKARQEALETAARAHAERRRQFTGADTPPVPQLLRAVRLKQNELARIKHELYVNVRQLKLVKRGFEWRLAEFSARKDDKEFKSEFRKWLKYLAEYQKFIQENRTLKVKLDMDRRNPDLQMSDQSYEKQLRTLNDKYHSLKHERDLYFKGILNKCKDDHDGLMVHVIQELEADCQDDNFIVPESVSDIREYYKQQMNSCSDYIEQAQGEIDRYAEEERIYATHLKALSKRDAVATHYNTLKELITDLNKSIYKKTSLIAKIHHYLVGERPTLKNHIITALLQAVAFLVFWVSLPASQKPTAIFATAVKVLSPPNSRQYAAADRTLRVFGVTDLFKLNKLRNFRNTFVQLLKVLDKNFVKTDLPENSFQFRIIAHYLRHLGISLEDLSIQREEESVEDYQKRLRALEKRLSELSSETTVLGISEAVPDNVLEFRRKVLTEMLKSKEEMPDENPKNNQVKMLYLYYRDQAVLQLHKEFLRELDKKIKRDVELSAHEIAEYVDSALLLERKIPDQIKAAYVQILLNRAEKKPEMEVLTVEELRRLQQFTEEGREFKEIKEGREYKEVKDRKDTKEERAWVLNEVKERKDREEIKDRKDEREWVFTEKKERKDGMEREFKERTDALEREFKEKDKASPEEVRELREGLKYLLKQRQQDRHQHHGKNRRDLRKPDKRH